MKIAAYCPTPSGHLWISPSSALKVGHLWLALTGIRPWTWPSAMSRFLRWPGAPGRSWHCPVQGEVPAQQHSTASQAPCKEREDNAYPMPFPVQQFDKALCLSQTAVPACRLRIFTLTHGILKDPLGTPADASMHVSGQQSRKGASGSTYVLHAKPEQGLWVAR